MRSRRIGSLYLLPSLRSGGRLRRRVECCLVGLSPSQAARRRFARRASMCESSPSYGCEVRVSQVGAGHSAAAYSFARRSSCALIATMTVLADIRTAANAGGSRMPREARTPAAKGIATML